LTRQQRRRAFVARDRIGHNYLFAGSDAGGERAAIICPVLGTEKINQPRR
jgi:hypothetical protein